MTPQNVTYCNQTLTLKNSIEESFLELGARLMNIRDNCLYEGQWESFEDYLLEFKNISEGTASRLINIYKKFVVEYNFAPKLLAEAGGWSVLAETLPNVNSLQEAEYWLGEATALTRTHLRRTLKEHKTGIKMDTCAHLETYTLQICKTCKVAHRIN